MKFNVDSIQDKNDEIIKESFFFCSEKFELLVP